LQIFL
jgi:hypothetical protein